MGRWCALKNYFVRKKAKRIVSIVQHRLQGTAQRGFEINLSHFISVHFWNSFNPKCLFGEMFTFFIHLSRNLTCPQSLQRKRARAEGRAFSPRQRCFNCLSVRGDLRSRCSASLDTKRSFFLGRFVGDFFLILTSASLSLLL